MDIVFSNEDIIEFNCMGILAIYLFGSRATDGARPESDVDLGAVFDSVTDFGTEVYGKLYDIVIRVLPREYLEKRATLGAHEVDMVFLQQAPIRLQYEATRGGVLLHESDREKRLAYEEQVFIRHCDLKPIYEIFHHELMERI
ncbi:MAG: nucleotidyltransferase domain-containing protein [bacterium]|nr:nucleotidyltransferase domain-containing protein [bacterium]